jgi:phosphoribosylformimino-5-aminoimidazole carboxamide ribotide isomerase
MDTGIDYLVMSSRMLNKRTVLSDICMEFPNKIILEIDTRNKAIEFIKNNTEHPLKSLMNELFDFGVNQFILSDIPEIGSVNYENLQKINRLSKTIELPIYAKGGINSMEDLKTLIRSKSIHLSGLLLGKVIYEPTFDLACAIKSLSHLNPSSKVLSLSRASKKSHSHNIKKRAIKSAI